MTFGAFGGRADIMDRFDPGKANAWAHAGTFNNNVLTMAAGYTGLSEVFTTEVEDAFFDRGNHFRTAMIDAVSVLEVPVQITGLGSMMAFHFCEEPPTAPSPQSSSAANLYELIHLDMMARGQFYARRGMFNMSLPTDDAQLDEFASCFAKVLKSRAQVICQYV